jgi:hypothetical protein
MENTHIQLRKELDGAVAAVTGNVHFTYTNEVNDNTVKYELVGLEAGNTVISSGDLNVKPGDNMMAFEIKRKFNLQDGKSYLLRVKNSRNEYWQMKFVYTK